MLTVEGLDLQSFWNYFAVTCSALTLSDGKVSYDKDSADDGRYPVNTTATFECDGEYYLYVNAKISATCEASGNWSQQTTCEGNRYKI